MPSDEVMQSHVESQLTVVQQKEQIARLEKELSGVKADFSTMVGTIKEALKILSNSGDHISFRGRVQSAIQEFEHFTSRWARRQEADQAIYSLTIKQRDAAWAEVRVIRGENQELRDAVSTRDQALESYRSLHKKLDERLLAADCRAETREKQLADVGKKAADLTISIDLARSEIASLKDRLSSKKCPVHDNQVHGKEADELRRGLELLIEHSEVNDFSVGKLLGSVDARDSLAYQERSRKLEHKKELAGNKGPIIPDEGAQKAAESAWATYWEPLRPPALEPWFMQGFLYCYHKEYA